MSIAAEAEYTETQLVNLGVQLIKNTNDFERGLETWLSQPVAARTWIAFKAHFNRAQAQLRRIRGPTMRNTAFANTANSIINSVREELSDEREKVFHPIEETKNSIINAMATNSDTNDTDDESRNDTPTERVNYTKDNVQVEILKLLKESMTQKTNTSFFPKDVPIVIQGITCKACNSSLGGVEHFLKQKMIPMSQVFGYINENEDVPFTFDKAFPYEYPCGNDVMNCDGKHVLDIDVMNGDGDDDDGGGKADKQVLDIDAMNGDSDDNDGGGKADKKVLDIDENPKDEAPWDDEGVSPKRDIEVMLQG